MQFSGKYMLKSVFMISVLAAGAVHAQTVTDGQWHGALSAGGSFANNNSTTQNLNFNADGSKATLQDKVSLYSLANYGRSTVNDVKTRTAQLLRAGGRYDYNLSPDAFAFGGAELETNKPQNINSRYALNAGAGYHVIRSKETAFDVFAGIGYSGKRFTAAVAPAPSSVNGAELLLGEEYSHQLSATSAFKQKLVIYPGQSDMGLRSTLDMSLATVVANAWTLNVGANINYNSKPGAGFKTTSSLLTVGFGYKY